MSLSKRIPVRLIVLVGVLVLLVVQLNFYFAWTSHVGQGAAGGFSSGGGDPPLRSFFVSEVSDVVRIQFQIPGLASFFTSLTRSGPTVSRVGFNGGGFSGGGGTFFPGSPNSVPMKLFIDTEVILFTIAIFVISLFLFKNNGFGVALLRAFEITSLAILPLGLEIFFFDRFQFNTHASDIQVLVGLAWFTNADVLFLSSAILGATLLLEVVRYTHRKIGNRYDRLSVGSSAPENSSS